MEAITRSLSLPDLELPRTGCPRQTTGHPLTSMPGTGAKTGARTLIEAGDRTPFPIAGQLAAYAGIAPATWSSDSEICGEQPSRRGKSRSDGHYFSLRPPSRRPGVAGLLRHRCIWVIASVRA